MGIALMSACRPATQEEERLRAFPSEKEILRPFGTHDEKAFVAPGKVHYPETWFHYIGGNVSHEGITADLEAFRQAGVGGVVYYDQVHGKAEDAGSDYDGFEPFWKIFLGHFWKPP